MVTNCCVCGVEQGSLQDFNFSFHSFPKKEDLKLKWSEAIGKKPYRTAHVCSKHFRAEDYKNYEDLNLIRKILKPSAVPSRHIKLKKEKVIKEIKLKPIKNSSSDIKDISTESRNDERLQIDESSISTSIDNPTSKKTFDNKATTMKLRSTADQTKERKVTHNTLKALKKQRYQNCILGIVRKEDFISENAWLRFQKYINKIKQQYQFLSYKNRKLQYEICNFKSLLKKQLSDDASEV